MKLRRVGNLIHDNVPDHDDESHNRVDESWGEELVCTQETKPYHHHQLLHMIGGYEAERGRKVAGHRGYYLVGNGMLLNVALYNYALQFLVKRQYKPIQPPFFVKEEIMEATCQIGEFEENLYRVVTSKPGKKKEANEGEQLIEEKKPEVKAADEPDDCYLIATSEQPISAFYMDEYLTADELPKRFAGGSTCFRKEAGAHGKDTWGIYRVHQFEKVEQFYVTHPEKSWEAFEEMMNNSKEFYQSLKLPYKVMAIVSGALNDAAAMKQDLEAWFPGYGEYRELVSVSNCTDYQSRN